MMEMLLRYWQLMAQALLLGNRCREWEPWTDRELPMKWPTGLTATL